MMNRNLAIAERGLKYRVKGPICVKLSSHIFDCGCFKMKQEVEQ